MKGKKTVPLLIAAVLLSTMIIASPSATIPPPPGPPYAWLWVNPEKVEYFDEANLTCTYFNVTVDIYNVTNLQAWEFKLWYNTTLLDAVYVYDTPITENCINWIPVDGYGVFHPDGPPTINNTIGRVWVGSIFPMGSPFNGTGSLVKIQFHIIHAPERGLAPPANRTVSCPLILSETGLWDNVPEPIAHGTEDGFYSYTRPQVILDPPWAAFTWTPIQPYVCQTVTCDGFMSAPNGGFITAYLWQIEGPATNTSAMDGPFMTFHCDGFGTVNVTLTVWDSEGLNDTASAEILQRVPVGGIWVPVDKLALLAPYIALASTILVATAATAIYVKRRKKKQ